MILAASRFSRCCLLSISVWAASAVLRAVQVESPVKLGADGHLVYALDTHGDRVPDFSGAGYKGGGVPLPLMQARVVVAPLPGDNQARIQAAIDYVSALPLDENGRRGAVLLGPGRFEIAGQLVISASGVVLRGAGTDEQGTTLVATGTGRRSLVLLKGNAALALGERRPITDTYVPVGANKLTLASIDGFAVGTQVVVERPCSAAWIDHLGMNIAPARTPFAWKPGTVTITWDRTIAAVSGNVITLDAPITTALETRFGGGTVALVQTSQRIVNVGVENLRCESAYAADNPRDEQHAWEAVQLVAAEDAWIRNVVATHFAGSTFLVGEDTVRITVQDCSSLAPVSELGGYRRHTFHTSGQRVLFVRCHAEDGRNDFTVGYHTAGPVVFLDCRAERSTGFSGSIGSWASGVLFDRVSIEGGTLRLDNLEIWNQGTGWALANSVLWQVSAAQIINRTPPGAHNWAIAVWGLFSGDGTWSKTSEFADPASLYRAQLADRLGAGAVAHLEPTNDYTKANQGALRIEDAVTDLAAKLQPRASADGFPLAVRNGWLTAGDRLLFGKQVGVTWWRGRLDPSRSSKEFGVGPAITRFAPGRSGLGLTDDLGQLTDVMRDTGQVAMRHHYGLWYDRRRDDHQRMQRADAEDWPPFYEQPWLRSGQGEAWDRLSRYDLTRFNPWYFARLNEFADLARAKGLVLINEMYFQHNILEAGAHWVDCPWRPTNCLQATGFTEPPPFDGDTVKMAEEFYDVSHPVRRALHRAYIRQCLSSLSAQPNVIHTLSEEYTGPLHFMEFWLDVADEWIRETGLRPTLALSATKDVQDAILADSKRAALISVIDLKYWWRTAAGKEFSPAGGQNLAPRQHQRKWKGGRPSSLSIADMTRDYRTRFPQKAVIAEFDEADGWAFVAAGGSLPKLPSTIDASLLKVLVDMQPAMNVSADSALAYVLVSPSGDYFAFLPKGGALCLDAVNHGELSVTRFDVVTGRAIPTFAVELIKAGAPLRVSTSGDAPTILLLRKL